MLQFAHAVEQGCSQDFISGEGGKLKKKNNNNKLF